MKKLILRSLLAGAVLSIAAACYVSSEVKYIGAVLFSLGLLVILRYNLALYTGAIKTLDKGNITTLLVILVFNIIGAQCFMLWGADSSALVAAKLTLPLGTVFVKAIGCGVLMAIGTMSRETPLITVMCVAVFILTGFEHSIADACYFAGCYSVETFVFVLVCVLGNSVGSIVFYRLWQLSQEQN